MKREFPFPAYPNGWFGIGYSDDVESEAVMPVEYFGRDLVVFRGEDGGVRVLDAHCPHLGAHLGYGGKVVGNTVRCPFHAWRFGDGGKCEDIPYAKRIPAKAKIRAWDVCEQNGLIFIWHHAEGRPAEAGIPAIEEYGAEGWGDYTRARWKVKSRMYDMGENPVDAQHFKYLHGGVAPDFRQVDDGRGGIRNVADLGMPTPRGEIQGSITSESYGPGFGIVHVRGVLHTIIVMANTPIDEEHVDVRFSYLQPRTDDPKLQRLGNAMIEELKRQMEADIPIFEHKKYLTRPLLLPEDGPIAAYRRNARKYYTGEFF
jgi:phenylpropionate dioxygenase-like ring-hydroxylating dioxygenase large terminal subunit